MEKVVFMVKNQLIEKDDVLESLSPEDLLGKNGMGLDSVAEILEKEIQILSTKIRSGRIKDAKKGRSSD